jgi:hypothetical protein
VKATALACSRIATPANKVAAYGHDLDARHAPYPIKNQLRLIGSRLLAGRGERMPV